MNDEAPSQSTIDNDKRAGIGREPDPNGDKPGRRYEVSEIVLNPTQDGQAWRPVSIEVCSSAHQAVRDYVLRAGLLTGEYRAVPVRNITQVKVAVKTTSQLSFA